MRSKACRVAEVDVLLPAVLQSHHRPRSVLLPRGCVDQLAGEPADGRAHRHALALVQLPPRHQSLRVEPLELGAGRQVGGDRVGGVQRQFAQRRRGLELAEAGRPHRLVVGHARSADHVQVELARRRPRRSCASGSARLTVQAPGCRLASTSRHWAARPSSSCLPAAFTSRLCTGPPGWLGKQHLPVVAAHDVVGGLEPRGVAPFLELDIQILAVVDQPRRHLAPSRLGDRRAPAASAPGPRRRSIFAGLPWSDPRGRERDSQRSPPSPCRDLTCSRYCFRPAVM